MPPFIERLKLDDNDEESKVSRNEEYKRTSRKRIADGSESEEFWSTRRRKYRSPSPQEKRNSFRNYRLHE